MDNKKIQELIAEAKILIAGGSYDDETRNDMLVRAMASLGDSKKDEEARYPSTVIFGDMLNMEVFRAALARSLEILAPAFFSENPNAADCLEHFPTYGQHELPERSDLSALSEYLTYHLKSLSVKHIAAISSMTLDVIIDGLAYADGLASLGRELRPGDCFAGIFHTSRIGRRRALGLK